MILTNRLEDLYKKKNRNRISINCRGESVTLPLRPFPDSRNVTLILSLNVTNLTDQSDDDHRIGLRRSNEPIRRIFERSLKKKV